MKKSRSNAARLPVMSTNSQTMVVDLVEGRIPENTLLDTSAIRDMMDGCGEFPSSYYVREEEIQVFGILMERWGCGYRQA